ncbi:hypothetical protein [Micromonospora sp. IBHARD004]|uniref:hypothetical protein n=1 Tax=Micromonospora sp. IBHARD004 TaxID=3457764 RepID=UPI004059AE94
MRSGDLNFDGGPSLIYLIADDATGASALVERIDGPHAGRPGIGGWRAHTRARPRQGPGPGVPSGQSRYSN